MVGNDVVEILDEVNTILSSSFRFFATICFGLCSHPDSICSVSGPWSEYIKRT